jgi:hypothetical protein
MADDTEIATLLRDIRDNQREAIGLQREYMHMYQRQLGASSVSTIRPKRSRVARARQCA